MSIRAAMQVRPLAVLLALAAAGLAASAQPSAPVAAPVADERLNPVEITAKRHQPVTHLPRYDVQRSCPDYGEQLKTSLARSLKNELPIQNSEMLVRFELKGSEITSVKTEGGHWHYRAPVRRAVRSFECAGDGQSTQQYLFQVVFRQDDEGDGGERIAVRSGPPLLALATVE